MGSGASSQFHLVFSLTTNRADPILNTYTEIFPVWSIAITSNGKQLAATTSDHKIHLWCLMTYKILISLTGHGDTVWHLQYSPDNRFLSSSSADGTVRLWDVESGFPVSIMRAHANWVWCVAWTPCSRYFATGGADSRIFLWNTESPLPMLGMQAHSKSIQSIAFSERDSRKMITGSADSLVGIWKVDWGESPSDCRIQLMAKLNGHVGCVNTIAVCPTNENLIASAGEDATVRFWNLHDLTQNTAQKSCDSKDGYNLEHFILHGHRETIWCLAFSMTGKLLATGSSDCSIRIWRVSAKQPSLLCFFRAHEGWVRSLCWTDDMQCLISGAADGLISLWAVPKIYHKPGVPNFRYQTEITGVQRCKQAMGRFLLKKGAVMSNNLAKLAPKEAIRSIPDGSAQAKYTTATEVAAIEDR